MSNLNNSTIELSDEPQIDTQHLNTLLSVLEQDKDVHGPVSWDISQLDKMLALQQASQIQENELNLTISSSSENTEVGVSSTHKIPKRALSLSLKKTIANSEVVKDDLVLQLSTVKLLNQNYFKSADSLSNRATDTKKINIISDICLRKRHEQKFHPYDACSPKILRSLLTKPLMEPVPSKPQSEPNGPASPEPQPEPVPYFLGMEPAPSNPQSEPNEPASPEPQPEPLPYFLGMNQYTFNTVSNQFFEYICKMENESKQQLKTLQNYLTIHRSIAASHKDLKCGKFNDVINFLEQKITKVEEILGLLKP